MLDLDAQGLALLGFRLISSLDMGLLLSDFDLFGLDVFVGTEDGV
tara:strand:- start:10 stop:144 length:135 start_codon:yes stop_codon:yes gene_type:complete